MRRPKVSKIQAYFKGLTPKTRLMLYVLGTGEFTIDQVRRMTVAQLKDAGFTDSLPSTLDLNDICYELISSKHSDSLVFMNTSGRGYSVRDVTEILKRAHKIAGVDYGGVAGFIQSVN